HPAHPGFLYAGDRGERHGLHRQTDGIRRVGRGCRLDCRAVPNLRGRGRPGELRGLLRGCGHYFVMWVRYNANPDGRNVGDCTIRALSLALGQSWEQTYVELALEGFSMGDMPSANHV